MSDSTSGSKGAGEAFKGKESKSIEADLKKQREEIEAKKAELNKRTADLDKKEMEAKNNFPKIFEEQYAALKAELQNRIEAFNKKEIQLIQKEKDLVEKETLLNAELEKIQNGISQERDKFDEECRQKRMALTLELDNKIQECTKQCDSMIIKLEEDLTKQRLDLAENTQKVLKQEREEMVQKTEELNNAISDYKNKSAILENEIENSKNRVEIYKSSLDGEYAAKFELAEGKNESLNHLLEERNQEIISIRQTLLQLEYLEQRINGRSLESLIGELDRVQAEKDSLKEKLALAPSSDIQKEYEEVRDKLEIAELQVKELRQRAEANAQKAEEYDKVKHGRDFLEQENEVLESYLPRYRAEISEVNAELTRLRTAYNTPKNREERIQAIEGISYIEEEKILKDPFDEKIEETVWLNDIQDKSNKFGLHFPRRILYAFHTALKIADISPITVLAGVSGTGKSELPRLYSAFGGFNFLNVPVQPNWDSPESMLGFFNSIDNRFDAQLILNFLAQTQIPEGPLSLSKQMNLILLDEMNLAHIELYFSDFLSKLEERRGKGRGEEPNISIKLGSGIDPYQLRLSRNVLWVGTMNQDETTKSLSDKVIDRGVLINFPRPEEFKRRIKLEKLEPSQNYLRYKSWNDWIKRDIIEDEKINVYKQFVEDINRNLSTVGRALGHRVWQSIELYMNNHPDVINAINTDGDLDKALETAFEDQLVQKVMPKLKGIETESAESKNKCLGPIKTMLEDKGYSIVKDYENACSLGYGQFNWCTAEYLKEESTQGAAPENPEEE